jgi:hypothetical protein
MFDNKELFHSTKNRSSAQNTVPQHKKLFHSTKNCSNITIKMFHNKELFQSTKIRSSAQSTVPQHKKTVPQHKNRPTAQKLFHSTFFLVGSSAYLQFGEFKLGPN